MVTKLRLVFSITIVFFSFYASGQSKYWEKVSASKFKSRSSLRQLKVQKGTVFSFQESDFKESLKKHSMAKSGSKIIYLPDSLGRAIAYEIQEASVLAPELARKYPEIKSFKGFAVNNPSDRLHLSVSHKDIQATIVHNDQRPNQFLHKTGKNRYALYSRTARDQKDIDFICSTQDKIALSSKNLSAKPVDEQVLRKYRVAVSATAEYTQFHGGTVADALAAINATITRVNQVFETDLAVTLEIVDNNEAVIYSNASTDPYNGSLALLGSQAQRTLDTEIGVANYDIGHVLHRGENGGNAGFIGGVCTNGQKGSAYSSGQQPEGDIFDIDFVAHEMGHQLGANHTWSYELEGTLVQVEPGSGSSIMGYAGITENDNVTPNGDDYFHYVSIDQITETLKTKDCGETFVLSNTPPVVQPVEDYVIPKSTAFVLSGAATDSDEGDVLTYSWEQIDNGVVTSASFGPTNPSGANFRSRPPTLDGTRYFPMLSRVLSGNLTQENPTTGSAWETVSDVERELNFAFTVRDNASGGGQVVSDLVNILVTNNSGPFAVTSQNTVSTLVAGDTEIIEWDVANTNIAPINNQLVDILLSNDGGFTYGTVLASGVQNDGSHPVIVPALPTTEARIMVKPVDNIYYAVNAADITIEVSEVVLNFPSLEYEVCQFDDLTVPFTYESYLGFNEEVVLTAEDLPENLQLTITPDTLTVGATDVELLFENTENVPEGTYSIKIIATSASITKEVVLELKVYDNSYSPVVLQAPVNGLTDASVKTKLEWANDPTVTAYEVQIATDPGFANIVEVATVRSNFFTPTDLQNQTTYYWRVRPENICGQGSFNSPFRFTTVQVSCDSKSGSGLPQDISAIGTPSITSKVSFFEDLPISDINVNLELNHSFLADLVVRLTSPQGTTVTLISNSCGDLQNLNATFDDDGDAFTCGTDESFAIFGRVKPLGALSSFNGESLLGDWVLEISDNASSDGGELIDFSLEVCVEGAFRPDDDNDGVFDDGDDQCLGTPEGAEVNTSGCQIFRLPSDNFTVNVQSESCRDNNDGSISIDPALKLDYEIKIVGGGQDITDAFTTDYSLDQLSSGTYEICITGMGADIVYEPYCFVVNLTQPEALSVLSSVTGNGSQLQLNLSGSDNYIVELNGVLKQTQSSEISLDLISGKNVLRVYTGLECQGVFEESYYFDTGSSVWPNPFSLSTQLHLDGTNDEVEVRIFHLNGQLISKKTYSSVPSDKHEIDFVGLPSGVYLIKVNGVGINETFKVIKR